MPLISSFYGILVYIYYRDHNPPHIHAKYNEFEAIIEIQTGKITKGNIPKRAYIHVQDWIELHKEEILENWELAKQGLRPFDIEPLV